MHSSRAAALISTVIVTATIAIFLGGCAQDPVPVTVAPPATTGPSYVAVMSSFPEELQAIQAIMLPDASKLQSTHINGIEFKSAQIGNRHYLFFLTGMSLVNASMNTQLAIDHFNVKAVFFSGIAGGIDPAFSPGDVVIPSQWHYHAETAYLNPGPNGQYVFPDYFTPKYKNFGMIFPDDVTVKRAGVDHWQQMASFPADEQLLSVAKRAVASLPPMKTGDHVNQVAVGGDGVSGTVFCDNADYRKFVFDVWKAECLDMESTGIAQVCWENKTPCLIVRGLSDLAGGQAGKNQEEQYLQAAADHSARVLARTLQSLDQSPTP